MVFWLYKFFYTWSRWNTSRFIFTWLQVFTLSSDIPRFRGIPKYIFVDLSTSSRSVLLSRCREGFPFSLTSLGVQGTIRHPIFVVTWTFCVNRNYTLKVYIKGTSWKLKFILKWTWRCILSSICTHPPVNHPQPLSYSSCLLKNLDRPPGTLVE